MILIYQISNKAKKGGQTFARHPNCNFWNNDDVLKLIFQPRPLQVFVVLKNLFMIISKQKPYIKRLYQWVGVCEKVNRNWKCNSDHACGGLEILPLLSTTTYTEEVERVKREPQNTRRKSVVQNASNRKCPCIFRLGKNRCKNYNVHGWSAQFIHIISMMHYFVMTHIQF